MKKYSVGDTFYNIADGDHYTIDEIVDPLRPDQPHHSKIIVYGDKPLRDRIVELLNADGAAYAESARSGEDQPDRITAEQRAIIDELTRLAAHLREERRILEREIAAMKKYLRTQRLSERADI